MEAPSSPPPVRLPTVSPHGNPTPSSSSQPVVTTSQSTPNRPRHLSRAFSVLHIPFTIDKTRQDAPAESLMGMIKKLQEHYQRHLKQLQEQYPGRKKIEEELAGGLGGVQRVVPMLQAPLDMVPTKYRKDVQAPVALGPLSPALGPIMQLISRLERTAFNLKTEGHQQLSGLVTRITENYQSFCKNLWRMPKERFLSELAELLSDSDGLGDRVVEINALLQPLQVEQSPGLSATRALLKELHLPCNMISAQLRAAVVKARNLNVSHPGFRPLLERVQHLKETSRQLQQERRWLLAHELEQIAAYYQDFCSALIEDVSARQERLQPMVQVQGPQVGFYQVPTARALQLLGHDRGEELAYVNNLQLHPNLESSIDYPTEISQNRIQPLHEEAFEAFCEVLFPQLSITSSSEILKVNHVPTTGTGSSDQQTTGTNRIAPPTAKTLGGVSKGKQKDIAESRYTSGLVRVSRVEGQDRESRWLTTIPLTVLLRLHRWGCFLVERLSKRSRDALGTQMCASAPALNKDELWTAFERLMLSVDDTDRCIEFQQTPSKEDQERLTQDPILRGRSFFSQGLEGWQGEVFDRYVQGEPIAAWAWLHDVLQAHPSLMEGQSLRELLELRELATWFPQLLPNMSWSKRLEVLKQIWDKVDRQAFSALVVATMLARPVWASSDNYEVVIKRKEKNQIDSLRIVCVAAGKPFRTHHDTLPGPFGLHRCALYGLPLMKGTLHESILQRLRTTAPVLILSRWLQQIDHRQQGYCQMQYQKGHTHQDGPTIDFGFTVSKGALHELQFKWNKLQERCNSSQPPSPNEILETLMPTHSKWYRLLVSKCSSPWAINHQLFHQRIELGDVLGGILPIEAHVKASSSEGPACLFSEEAKGWCQKLDIANLNKAYQFEVAQRLASYSFGTELTIPLDQANQFLHRSAVESWPHLAKLALQAQADVNHQDLEQQSALHLLAKIHWKQCWYKQTDPDDILRTAIVLLSHPEIKPNLRDRQGQTPILQLVGGAHANPALARKLLFMLLAAGGDSDIQETFRETTRRTSQLPIQRAMHRNNPEIFVDLVRCGAGRGLEVDEALFYAYRHFTQPGIADSFKALQWSSPQIGWQLALTRITQTTPPKAGHIVRLEDHDGVELYLQPQTAKQFDVDTQVVKTSDILWTKDPHLSANSLAVASLIEQLIGHGVFSSAYFRCWVGDQQPFTALAQHAPSGQPFEDVLRSDPQTISSTLARLDEFRLHNLILTALILGEKRTDRDDYWLAPLPNQMVKGQLQLIRANPTRTKRTTEPSSSDSKRGNPLFCLGVMDFPLNPRTCQLFLQHDAYQLLKQWLEGLVRRQQVYKEHFGIGKAASREWKKASFPQIALPTGFVRFLLTSLTEVQAMIRVNNRITPSQIQASLDPEFASSCQQARMQKRSLLDRWRSIYGDGMPLPNLQKGKRKQRMKSPKDLLEELQEQDTLRENLKRATNLPKNQNTQAFATLCASKALSQARALHLIAIPHLTNHLLGKALGPMRQLRRLSVAGCTQLTHKALPSIVALPFLEDLDMRECKGIQRIGRQFPQWIVPMLKLRRLQLNNCTGLELLYLRADSLVDLQLSGCAQLKKYQVVASGLEQLALDGCRSLSLPTLQSVAKGHSALRTLNLRKLPQLATQPHAATIQRFPLLLRLPLERSAQLATQLNQQAEQTTISFVKSRLNDAEAIAIANGLGTQRSLRSLRLSGNQIGDVGARALMQLAKENARITIIDLSHNQPPLSVGVSRALEQQLDKNRLRSTVLQNDLKRALFTAERLQPSLAGSTPDTTDQSYNQLIQQYPPSGYDDLPQSSHRIILRTITELICNRTRLQEEQDVDVPPSRHPPSPSSSRKGKEKEEPKPVG